MSTTLSDIRPPVIHHEHSPWPRRYATLIGVVGLHVLAGAGLLAIHLNAPATAEPPILTVQWVPSQQQAPQPEKPQEKPKDPPKKHTPEPVQKQPVPVPQTKPMEAPVIQAPTTAVAAAVETPQAPPAPPPPAPAPVAAAAPTAPPIDTNLKPSVDCTQSPINYPEASKKLGEEGLVLLRMQVDERGHPLRVEVEKGSGYQRLDRAARDTVATSWICPLSKGKQGYTGWLRVPVKFELSLN